MCVVASLVCTTVRVAMVVVVIVVVMMMLVSMNVIVSMSMRMLRRVDAHGFLSDDAELRRANARSYDLFRPHRIRRDGEAAERAADVAEHDTSVDQRTEHHVAGGAREAIEVQDAHNRIILSRRA
jgi:hypothetical protein